MKERLGVGLRMNTGLPDSAAVHDSDESIRKEDGQEPASVQPQSQRAGGRSTLLIPAGETTKLVVSQANDQVRCEPHLRSYVCQSEKGKLRKYTSAASVSLVLAQNRCVSQRRNMMLGCKVVSLWRRHMCGRRSW